MSPVHSQPAPPLRIRRRCASTTTVGLFPECLDVLSPTQMVHDLDAAAPPERAHARLVGIARLAASSPPVETRRNSLERPEYFLLPVKSILNRCDSKRVPFEWTINPYRGCEFACKYCYARYTHEYMELDVCVGESGRRKAGSHRHWDGDGPISTGGARTRCDAGVPGGIG
jgi:hypothetical protein